MSQAFDGVAHLLVTADNPPQDVDGMDYERCVALHNAILKHGWTQSGRRADDFEAQARPWLESHPEDDQTALHSSVLAFLREARALPPNHPVHFFYNVAGINLEIGGHDDAFPESDNTLTLYDTYMALATQADGLVYMTPPPPTL